MGEWTESTKEEVEVVFAFGKYATRGAVRIKSEEAMWNYFVSDRGKLQHEANGVKIYANPDSIHDTNPD